MERPQTRASSLHFKIMDYIYKENGSDWALVADRLEEVVAQLPQKVDAGVELGNAYLRLGRRDEAIGAYQRLLDQDKVPVRSEEHTSELQSLMRISYAVFCLKKKKKPTQRQQKKQKTTQRENKSKLGHSQEPI